MKRRKRIGMMCLVGVLVMGATMMEPITAHANLNLEQFYEKYPEYKNHPEIKLTTDTFGDVREDPDYDVWEKLGGYEGRKASARSTILSCGPDDLGNHFGITQEEYDSFVAEYYANQAKSPQERQQAEHQAWLEAAEKMHLPPQPEVQKAQQNKKVQNNAQNKQPQQNRTNQPVNNKKTEADSSSLNSMKQATESTKKVASALNDKTKKDSDKKKVKKSNKAKLLNSAKSSEKKTKKHPVAAFFYGIGSGIGGFFKGIGSFFKNLF